MNISEKIMLHAKVYEAYGQKVPPYRLTYLEHAELVKLINEESQPKNVPRYDFIACYRGIEVEVMTLIR